MTTVREAEGNSNKIFSSIVRFETIQLTLALTALENWHIKTLDVCSTYLYGKLTKEIYMKQPNETTNKASQLP